MNGSRQSNSSERHVVLVAPEIHWNTGNIGRTCLAARACLHLIKPLGFSLESRELKRAGLDYWSRVQPAVWEDFETFLSAMSPDQEELALFSSRGAIPFWSMPACRRRFLVFGSESRGLPAELLLRFPRATYRIPVSAEIRSLNLSTAVGIALYESLRVEGRSDHTAGAPQPRGPR